MYGDRKNQFKFEELFGHLRKDNPVLICSVFAIVQTEGDILQK